MTALVVDSLKGLSYTNVPTTTPYRGTSGIAKVAVQYRLNV